VGGGRGAGLAGQALGLGDSRCGGCATFLGETSTANGGHGTAGLITATEGVFAGFDS